MSNLKIYKNTLGKRITAIALSATIFAAATGLSGCKNQEESSNSPIVTTVEETNKKLDVILPEANDSMVNNASIMLLLDIIAKKDENGKISADQISNLKSKIDVNDMMNEFTSFLDMLGFKIKQTGVVEKVSTVLPEELNNDKIILANIETILENIIKYSKEGNKNNVVKEFNKIYTLFVEEKEVEVNGVKFEIRNLTFPSRAVATTYAETAAYYSKNYITKEQYEKIDKRTNDQNNKAYIKEKLEILDNQMEEQSQVDVIKLFNNKYEEVFKMLNNKVNISQESVKNLINFMNIKYLDGDKVSLKDKNQILGEYTDEKINGALEAISVIQEYNFRNQNNFIRLSNFLVDEHLKTDFGKVDKISLDFVQFNTIMMNNEEYIKTYDQIKEIVYFNNVYKYFTKQNFVHVQKDVSGNLLNQNVVFQEISESINFVNYQIILNSLNKLPKIDNKDTYIKFTQDNLGESIQYIQNTMTGECKKVDIKKYIKTK